MDAAIWEQLFHIKFILRFNFNSSCDHICSSHFLKAAVLKSREAIEFLQIVSPFRN